MYRQCLGKAKIKLKALVYQDQVWMRWGEKEIDTEMVFEVYALVNGCKDCVAFGYGVLGNYESYGFGSLYVEDGDLIWMERY